MSAPQAAFGTAALERKPVPWRFRDVKWKSVGARCAIWSARRSARQLQQLAHKRPRVAAARRTALDSVHFPNCSPPTIRSPTCFPNCNLPHQQHFPNAV